MTTYSVFIADSSLGKCPRAGMAPVELRRLPVAVAGPHAEDVLVAVQIYPDRGVNRLVADLPVADLHHDGVDEHRGVAFSNGRHQACISSITRSVIRDTVSLLTEAP